MPDLPDDLRALLAARAQHAPTPRPVPAPSVLRRVHRRRAARLGVAAGGTTLAVVATVAVGAAALRADGPPRLADALGGGRWCAPVTHHLRADGVRNDHMDGRINYPRHPPNYGPHSPRFLVDPPRRFTLADAPPVEQVVHSLEHGYVVIWYDADRADVAALDAVLRDAPKKAFAVPWTRSELPTPYVMTAWGHEMRCTEPSAEVLEAFADGYGGSRGDAPEGNGP